MLAHVCVIREFCLEYAELHASRKWSETALSHAVWFPGQDHWKRCTCSGIGNLRSEAWDAKDECGSRLQREGVTDKGTAWSFARARNSDAEDSASTVSVHVGPLHVHYRDTSGRTSGSITSRLPETEPWW